MADTELTVRLATVEAELKSRDEKVTALEARLKSLDDAFTSLQSKLSATEKERDELKVAEGVARASLSARTQDVKLLEESLEGVRKDLRATREHAAEIERASLAQKVTQFVRQAIAQGTPASCFDGYEKDPVKWLEGSYPSFDAMEKQIRAIPKVSLSGSVKSGAQNPMADEDAELSPDRVANLRALGLNPKFATVANARQFAEVKEKDKK